MGNDMDIDSGVNNDTRPVDLIAAQTISKDARDPQSSNITTASLGIPTGTSNTDVNPQPTNSQDFAINGTKPPLPTFFDSGFGGSNYSNYEQIRAGIFDALKNITINGASPQISGGSIQFEIPNTKMSAPSLWATSNNVYIEPTIDKIETPRTPRTPEINISLGVPMPITDAHSKIQNQINDAISNNDFSSVEKLVKRLKNIEKEEDLRGVDIHGEFKDRRSLIDIAKAEGIDTSNKTQKEIKDEIIEKRGGRVDEKSNEDTNNPNARAVRDNTPDKANPNAHTLKDKTPDIANSNARPLSSAPPARVDRGAGAMTNLVPFYVRRANESEPAIVYLVSASAHPVTEESTVGDKMELEGITPKEYLETDEYFVTGGTTSGAPFAVTRNSETGALKVNGGCYQIANTTTDVAAKTVSGNYVYAQIKNTGGTLNSFTIIGSASTLPVAEGGTTAVAQVTHNVLLAEVITTGSGSNQTITVNQRRQGNFTLIHGVVNGRLALLPFSTGGTINPNV